MLQLSSAAGAGEQTVRDYTGRSESAPKAQAPAQAGGDLCLKSRPVSSHNRCLFGEGGAESDSRAQRGADVSLPALLQGSRRSSTPSGQIHHFYPVTFKAHRCLSFCGMKSAAHYAVALWPGAMLETSMPFHLFTWDVSLVKLLNHP